MLYVRSKMMGWPVKPAAPWTLVWRSIAQLLAPPMVHKLGLVIALFCLVLFLILTAAVFRRGLLPEGVFVGGTLLLLLTSGTLDGIQRYVIVLFPCFLPLALWLRRRPALGIAYLFAGFGSGVVLLHRYVHWIFVG